MDLDEQQKKQEEEILLKNARIRAAKIRQFYKSLITFVLVNILLLVINLIFSPRQIWFYWVTIIWAVVLLFQAFNTFTIRNEFLGDAWEEKKARDLVAKEKAKRERKF